MTLEPQGSAYRLRAEVRVWFGSPLLLLYLPIDIENTLESRFAKNKEDLIITASQGLWNDLKESPWQTQQIMSQLLSKG